MFAITHLNVNTVSETVANYSCVSALLILSSSCHESVKRI